MATTGNHSDLLHKRESLVGQHQQDLAGFREQFAANLLHEKGRGSGFDLAAGSDLIGVREVASRLGVSTPIVYRLCERGELPYVRVGVAIRIALADLRRYVDRQRG